MHILCVSYYAKLPLVFLREAASHCRDQTGPFPLPKRQPVQTVNHGSEGGSWGGRQFAQPLNIMLSHCATLHVVISGEKQDAPLPIYRHDTRRRCFPPPKNISTGVANERILPFARARARLQLSTIISRRNLRLIRRLPYVRVDLLYLYQPRRRFLCLLYLPRENWWAPSVSVSRDFRFNIKTLNYGSQAISDDGDLPFSRIIKDPPSACDPLIRDRSQLIILCGGASLILLTGDCIIS